MALDLIVGRPVNPLMSAEEMALNFRLRSDREAFVRDGNVAVNMKGDTDEFKQRVRVIMRRNGYVPLDC